MAVPLSCGAIRKCKKNCIDNISRSWYTKNREKIY